MLTNLQKANLEAAKVALKRVKSISDKHEVWFSILSIRTAFIDFGKKEIPEIASAMMWLNKAMKYGADMESSIVFCVKDALWNLEKVSEKYA